MNRRSMLLVGFVWVTTLLTSCHRTGPIVIGVVLPFSGELGEGGAQLRRALEAATVAVRDDVEFIYRDDRGMPSTATQWVLDLAERGVSAIVGGMSSSCALATASRAESLHIPLISTMATHADVTRDRSWVFRMCFTDPQQGKRMAEFGHDQLKLARVAILRNATNDYSIGLGDAFASEFLRRGGNVVGERIWRRDYDRAEDLDAWLSQMNCDGLYMPLYSRDIADVLEKSVMYRATHDLILLGGDGWHVTDVTRYLHEANEPTDDIFVTAHFARDRDTPLVRRFLGTQSRGDQPTDGVDMPTSSASIGFDVGLLLTEVIESGARDRESIRDAIREALTHFEGASGDIYLSPDGKEMTKEIPILTWTDDGWRKRN